MNLFSQGYEVDFKSPTSVVKAIFYAAKTGEFETFGGLCDPIAEDSDSDVKTLCRLGYGLTNEDKMKLRESGQTMDDVKQAIKEVFGNSDIIGPTRFEETDTGKFAYVDFYFYPDGSEGQVKLETMILVQRGNNWYLSSY